MTIGVTEQLPPITVDRWVNSPPLTPDHLHGRVVLIDIWEYTCVTDGRLVDRWVGEGAYEQVESEIRRLLGIRTPGIELPPVSGETTEFAATGEPSYLGITPETYLGTDRGVPGSYAAAGDWRSEGDHVELASGGGELGLPFDAGEVNLVVDPGPAGPASVQVLLDGNPIGPERGADVGPDGVAPIDRARMIRLVAGASRGDRLLTIVADQPGLRAYVFTFGP
ncbi:redoxin [Verrucosispora sp. WMMD573]|uniref:redoxin n=1 Tax=Verrucosispora sp. WMMD573 TaxID=3015149 RepID=UPI00248B682D|nr:redoxin [Verrucosispora sp. WMMD573]WBB55510.1 redoxin [Verrucosispora sp. WMMD573]